MLSPDIAIPEMLIIAAVALIVVGPKDLPVMLRKLGQFIARLRGMAAEFRASLDDMARQSELDELRKEVAAMRSGQFGGVDTSFEDPTLNQVFSDIDAGLRSGEVRVSPAMVQMPPPPADEPVAKPARKPRAKKAATAEAAAKPARKAAAKPKAPRAAAIVDSDKPKRRRAPKVVS